MRNHSFLFLFLFGIAILGRAHAADSAGGDAAASVDSALITAKAEALAEEFTLSEPYVSDRTARAVVPNVFKNGAPAMADEVNANFESLQSAINGIDGIDSWLFNVDCGSDPAALQNKLTTTTEPNRFLRYYLISGRCEVGLFTTNHSNIYVVGADETAAIVPDEATADVFGLPLIFWDVSAGGQLAIGSVTLGSHLFTAYYNGTVRFSDVTFGADSVLSLFDIRRGSHVALFGTWGYPEGAATTGITLRTGASGRFDAAGLKANVTMRSGASAECSGCSNFQQLTLDLAANSSFLARFTGEAHLPITSIKLRHNSTFIQQTGPCTLPPYSLEKDGTSVADFCFQ